ncbi:MAG: hypothetical protein GWN56_12195 [Nitrosopumilaceae archaeon]|nr:hypothetical protein [Nitrosopumilaceae archaeon]
MCNNKKNITNTKVSSKSSHMVKKREYKKPTLKDYGKLKDITMGGSPGTGDSGNPTLFEPPG